MTRLFIDYTLFFLTEHFFISNVHSTYFSIPTYASYNTRDKSRKQKKTSCYKSMWRVEVII